MTRAERETEARKMACPWCHVEAGKPCRTHPGNAQWRWKPMKGIHAERLALVPK